MIELKKRSIGSGDYSGKMKKLLLSLCLSTLLLGGCATKKPPGIDVPGDKPGQTILPSSKTSAAVIKLLNRARSATRNGDYQKAEVLLERTVRIEPENAVLWHYLAKLRLHQGRMKEAIGLAAKSNTLARKNYKLKADNWRIIAHARHQSGNIYGAKEAQAKTDALLQK